VVMLQETRLQRRDFPRAVGKPRRAGRFIVTLTALGLGLAGCAGDPADTNVPASDGGNTTQDERTAAMVKYSQCLRENGVPSFPDPVGGRLQLQVRPGSDLDPDSPQFKAAEEACKGLQPPGLAQSGQGGAQQEAMLKFVACMRENGVPKFPDPQPDGRMRITGGDGVDPESPQFKAAQEKCRKLMPGGGAPGQG
jgi:hypothetical protein